MPENLLIRKLDHGHRFADEFKWEAYKKLKEYFGILPERAPVSLASIANEAWRATAGFLSEGVNVKFLGVSGQDHMVVANRKQILSALAGLYLYLSDRSLGITLAVSIDTISGRPCFHCVCSGENPIPKQPTLSDFESLRCVDQILAEHEAKLSWEHTGRDLICSVIFPQT